ncbi:hypothetical protein IMCC3135_22715 [Granulosicoccus antarcticus IMCC3135]|uniref:Oligosaccharide repeat unit polymerase n=2 Tax=Granulosicoccus TaxID=437504 RepID=A0A2Z2NTM0_9GAMM|nr:hypothetical protein IMCC3135_22715 [Granulosicoccus antarcticus IMCC3135]
MAGIAYVLFCGLIFYITRNISRVELKVKYKKAKSILFGVHGSLIFAGAFFAISCWSAIYLGSSFRQVGQALSEVGLLGYLLVIGKMYGGVAILVNYRCVIERSEVFPRSLALALIALSFSVNTQAAIDVILAAGAFVACTHSFRRKLPVSRRLVKKASLILAPILVLAVFIAGKSNKIGFEETMYIVTDIDLLAENFVTRLGYHFYSVSTHVTENMFNFTLSFEAIREVFSVLLFRFGSLVGMSVERPELGTIARMNFMQFSGFYVDRIGTSPSMLGSIFYFPGAGIAIVYYTYFIRFIIYLFWRIMGELQNSWLFTILAILVMTAAVDSSLDALNPLSVGFMRILFLILGGNYIMRRFSNTSNLVMQQRASNLRNIDRKNAHK